jgi:hypothetical protein
MAAPGYLPHQGVLTVEQADELGDWTQNAPGYLKTKGRYKPYGVIHRKDRLPEDEEDFYFQKIRRKGFVSGGPTHLGPGSNRGCTNAEDEVYSDGIKYCRKKCKAGWTRNEDTHRCYKQDAVRRRRFECREGYTRNQATGRCRKFAIDPLPLDPLPLDPLPLDPDELAAMFAEQGQQGANAVPLNQDQVAALNLQNLPVGGVAPIPAQVAQQVANANNIDMDDLDAIDMDELLGWDEVDMDELPW